MVRIYLEGFFQCGIENDARQIKSIDLESEPLEKLMEEYHVVSAEILPDSLRPGGDESGRGK